MSRVAYQVIDQTVIAPTISLVPEPVQVLDVRDLRVELLSGRVIIDEVSFTLRQGEIIGLVGESGSGKTTLATALLSHARKGAQIVAGHVSINGISVLDLDEQYLRRVRGSLVGYVPQDPAMALNPALRVGTLLRETLLVHEPGLSRSVSRDRLLQTLHDVGLPADDDFLRRFPHQLSGGQQQRVLLALAFVLHPQLIVLDEPTTALDVTTQAHILQTLRRLCKSQGVAAVYVSHDLALVKGLVDHVMVMYGGRIVESASKEDLFSHPTHPYSISLLEAIPDIKKKRADSLARRDENVGLISLSAQALAENEPSGRLLQISQLNVAYDRQVLFDVSLHIHYGECLALVGESGSGKTTLARVLAGLGENAYGHIHYAGQPLSFIANERDPGLRHQIQYIFQNPYRSLNPRQTVAQSLAAPLQHFFGLGGQPLQDRIAQVLKQVSLPVSIGDAYPGSLSGGERQRISIARALLCEPKLIICDEITSALDVSVQASILALLRELQRSGVTLLFVTHDLGVVRAIADRVVVLQHGKIVEQGLVDEVLDAPKADYTRTLIANSTSLL